MMFKFQVDHVLLSDLSSQSLRDPNTTQTLSAFRGGVEWVRAGKFTQQDIDEAKLSVFSAVDAPVAPSDKGQWCGLCLGHLSGILAHLCIITIVVLGFQRILRYLK